MKKFIYIFLIVLFVLFAFNAINNFPFFSQVTTETESDFINNAFLEKIRFSKNLSVESEEKVFYSGELINIDKNIAITLECSLDENSEEILFIDNILDIKSLDDFYINPTSPTLYKKPIILDNGNIEFGIQFYALTTEDPFLGARYTFFEVSL